MKTIQYLPMTLLALAILSGCNTIRSNASLDVAHSNYNNAHANPEIANLAAPELKEARDSLYVADIALNKGDDTSMVNHLAYLANQRVAIAQETAKRKSLESAIDKAIKEPNQALEDARTVEQQAEELAAANANSASDQALIAKQTALINDLNAKQTNRGMVITLGDVLFSINKSELKSGGMRSLQKLADFLKEYPQNQVLIEGYTDSTGSDGFNQRLSERRAETLRRALVNVAGISPDRVSTRGYGKEFPVASNDTATSRQLNRRVEIIISDEKGQFAPR